MTETKTQPALEYREAEPCVYIPISVTLMEWDQANALVPEILGWMDQRGVEPAGPLFYRSLVIGDMETPYDLEIGFPVAVEVSGDDRVRTGEMPAGIYATLVHQGHPDGLFDASAALESWSERKGVTLAMRERDGRDVWAGRYERFLSNPDEVPDLNEWTTEVAYLTEGSN